MRFGTLVSAALAALAAAGCAAAAPSAQTLADDTTKAIYANDLDGTTAHFDDRLKKDVSRAQLGQLSDKMHAFGAYKSLTQKTASPDTGRYDFDAAFDKGTILIQIRMDPDGKLGAYHIVVPS